MKTISHSHSRLCQLLVISVTVLALRVTMSVDTATADATRRDTLETSLARSLLWTKELVNPSTVGIQNEGCVCGTASTLQTLRGQISLYQIQHHDTPPDGEHLWSQLCYASNQFGMTTVGTPTPDYPLGPYVNGQAINLFNRQSAFGTKPSPTVGWVYSASASNFTLQAVNTTGNAVLTY